MKRARSPEPAPAPPEGSFPTPLDLGFAPHDEPLGPHGETLAWTKPVRERRWVVFRLLRTLSELLPVEGLQREVFGLSDRDLVAASELVAVPETGGEVIGAFASAPGTAEELIGFVIGWGGYYHGRPRIVSDALGVRADARSLGLGADLKRLQAAIALERGFVEIVWTVDPLRATNARLNFEKLGAYAGRYEENRYGEGFGSGLYGDLPTDRLHLTWPITTRRVHDRLLGRYTPLQPRDLAGVRHFDPFASGQERALVYLPGNIDLLRAQDPNAALRWRITLRETLQLAFNAGYAITGFVPDVDPERGFAAYLLERRSTVEAGAPDTPATVIGHSKQRGAR